MGRERRSDRKKDKREVNRDKDRDRDMKRDRDRSTSLKGENNLIHVSRSHKCIKYGKRVGLIYSYYNGPFFYLK